MTAFRRYWRGKTGWLSCGLLGVLLFLGGFRLAAQPPSAPEQPEIFLGTPTLEVPGPTKALRPVAAQLPLPKEKLPVSPVDPTALLRLDVPGPEILFRLESEEDLRERMRQENKGKTVEFPDARIVLSKLQTVGPRDWATMEEVVEPYYTVYRRLYFEQINAERYGWDFGYFHPLIATGTFWFDVATLPLQIVAEPCRRFEYNSGLCLPGDPVPLLLYPPHPK